MKKTNYKLIFKAILPIAIILFFILLSELRTEGSFGGLVRAFKIMMFFILGIGVFLYTLIKNFRKIKKGNEVKESKIILTVLTIATFIGVSAFWFPYDFFDKEPEFIASNIYGNKLTLANGKYMLKIREIEWTSINRGHYKISSDTIVLDIKDDRYLAKRATKYLIRNNELIPVYSNGIETDSTGFLKIELIIKN